MNRTSTQVIEDHLTKRLKGDTEGDIRDNFSPDIVILSSFGVYRGHDGVRQSASKLDEMLKDATFHYNHTLIEKDYAFLEWTASAKEKNICDGVDSFVVHNSKIVMQTIHYSLVSKQ
jgi:hypothetical protein